MRVFFSENALCNGQSVCFDVGLVKPDVLRYSPTINCTPFRWSKLQSESISKAGYNTTNVFSTSVAFLVLLNLQRGGWERQACGKNAVLLGCGLDLREAVYGLIETLMERKKRIVVSMVCNRFVYHAQEDRTTFALRSFYVIQVLTEYLARLYCVFILPRPRLVSYGYATLKFYQVLHAHKDLRYYPVLNDRITSLLRP